MMIISIYLEKKCDICRRKIAKGSFMGTYYLSLIRSEMAINT